MSKDNTKKITMFEITEDDKNSVKEQLNNIYFSIDLNTNKVKQTNQVGFIIDLNKTTEQDLNDIYIDGYLQKIYLDEMYEFNKDIDKYIDKKYKDLKDLNNNIFKFNTLFSNIYLYGFNLRIKNYLDEYIKNDYINKTADARADIQLTELKQKLDDKTSVLSIDLDNTDAYFIVDKDILKGIFKAIKSKLDKGDIKDNEVDKQLFIEIKAELIKVVSDKVNKSIKKHLDYYNEVSKLYNEIDSKIIKIVDNFKRQYNKTSDLEIIDNKIIVKRNNTKLPKTYTIDFDIMKLFNNIYPNFKYKSIDDDRHKDLDIKAKLMLDLESDTSDINKMFQNMRLVEFIKNGYITLFPIQSALINGFIDIRDKQDTIDESIPFLSTLKHITQDKNLRYPKSEKDIQLYEDFMLFFDRCKIQIKILDRKTSKLLYETYAPISLLKNTQTYKNDSGMSYVIGNSIINILKNELDNIYKIPHRTTLQTNKGYLTSKLPKTPTTINLSQYIDEKISKMINSYQKRGKYQSLINIQPLYDFQALYNKHAKPTKDDRQKVREMLNKYLDAKIRNKLIKNYTSIDKKEITQYKIEINKDIDK